MSLIAYTGLPGHGKSYSVVENVIIPALRAGRVVAHNLVLKPRVLSIVCDRDVSAQLVAIDRSAAPSEVIAACPAGAVIVLDEVWRYWGAGLKVGDVERSEVAFFKEHRHRVSADGKAGELVIVDQELGSGVARFIRDLVEFTYIHKKHSDLGLSKRFKVDVYAGAQNRSKPSQGAHIRTLQGRYKPEVWNCYESHTQKSDKLGEAGLEELPDNRANIWKSWTVRSAGAAILVIPFVAWLALRSFFAMAGTVEPPSHEAPVSAPVAREGTERAPAALSTQRLPGSLPAPDGVYVQHHGDVGMAVGVESARWRLRGFVRTDRTEIAIIESVSGTRVIAAKNCELAVEWRCFLDGELITEWTGVVVQGYMPPLPLPVATP